MKRKITNAMLLITALLLGSFILFVERGTHNSYQKSVHLKTLFAIYPDSIERIQMERDNTLIECVKTAGTWQMKKPTETPVDSGIIDKIIDGLARVERGEIITEEALRERNLTPADYGFNKPRARITFKNSRGTFSWLIGRDAPVGKSLYVMAENGGDITSAPSTLINLIPTDPKWIRERTIFSDEPATIRGLDMRRPSGFLRLRNNEETQWEMQQPYQTRVDPQTLQTLITNLTSVRIVDFITDEKTDLAVYGLEKPAYEITVLSQEEQTQTVLIGNLVADATNTLYAKNIENHSVFTVSAEWARLLDVKPDVLRSRHLVNLQSEKVTSIQLSHQQQQIEMTRITNQWQMIRPIRWDAHPAKVEELLKLLIETPIVEFIDTPSAEQSGQTTSPSAWTILLATDGMTNVLHISEPNSAGLRLVQFDQSSSLCYVPASIIRDAHIDPLFYRSLSVLEIDPVLIQTITVQKLNQPKESVQKTETGAYISGQLHRQVNPGSLTGIMWELNDLTTKRYIDFSPTALSQYGLDQPQATLTVTLNDTNIIGRVILIGNPTDDGRFAMIQGMNIIFVMSEKSAQTLTCDLTVPIENQTPEINEP